MDIYYFDVFGHPRPKGSYTPIRIRGSNKVYLRSSPTTVAWEKHVKAQVKEKHVGEVTDREVRLNLVFVLPKPRTVRRDRPVSMREGDIDKLSRTVLDALTGTLYKDDSQVFAVFAEKRYPKSGEKTGVYIQAIF